MERLDGPIGVLSPLFYVSSLKKVVDVIFIILNYIFAVHFTFTYSIPLVDRPVVCDI